MLILLLLSWLPLIATIESIHTLSEIPLEVKNETLAVFDIDDTLTILHEPAFQRPNFKIANRDLFNELMAPLNSKEKLLAFTLPLLLTAGDLMEERAPAIIKGLQSRGAKALALTAALAGLVQEELVEDRRIAELNRVGIDFALSFPDTPEMLFTHFPAPLVGSYPLFKQGVIFTNENDKGQVLVAFLKTLSWIPLQVLFIDDRLEHLFSVEKALTQYDPAIVFKGFHFQPNPERYQATDEANFREKWTQCIEQAKVLYQQMEVPANAFKDL